MSHAILIGRQVLRFPGCRAQYIKNVSSFRANIAIKNRFGEVGHVWRNMDSFYQMFNEIRNRVEYQR